jgi:hypothetical protein
VGRQAAFAAFRRLSVAVSTTTLPDDPLARVSAAADRVGPGLDHARAAARSTFFHPSQGGPSLLGRFLSWIFAHLGGRLDVHGSSVAGLLRLGALALLIAGAVALVVRFFPRRRPSATNATEREPVAAGYAAARAEALRLADDDPRAALRMLYAAALGELGRRRGWRPRPGRTNWGFVRALGPTSTQAGALADCTRLFEGAVYGDAPVAADDVRRADALAEAMLA